MLVSPETMGMEGRERKAVGSLLIVQAKTIEEVRKMIESDVYYTSGVVSGTNAKLCTSNSPVMFDSGTARKSTFYHSSLLLLSSSLAHRIVDVEQKVK
jgi:hypothetical protein